MATIPLFEELKKLRESSKNAVANGSSYNLDQFKEYMHIQREVEKELVDKIKQCSSSTNAQLLMVCGNVGDGKSHILSYLNQELKDELSKFIIHNDATESHNPNERSNDTLNRLLEEFKDVNIMKSSKKIILAINLGTLNNFIQEYGSEYAELIKYVSSNNILDTDLVQDDNSNENSNFRHVNFTDYHIYSLTENGPISLTISTLLAKLVSKDQNNPIYRAYTEYISNYSFSIYCPIRYNYEFLFKEANQDTIINLIIQAVVKNKVILSVRSLLNFLFDLIVPVGLRYEDIDLYTNQINKMLEVEYLSYLIPNYLFEHPELSSLFESIYKLDPCVKRYSVLDSCLIQLVNSDNPVKIFIESIGEDAVKGIEEKIRSEKISKNDLTKLFIRLNFFGNRREVLHLSDPYFEEYMKYLFYFNNNEKKTTQHIYNLIRESGRRWYGDPKKNKKVVLNLGRNQSKYRVFKDFIAIALNKNLAEKHDNNLVKFVQEFPLDFKLDGQSKNNIIHVDYGLYEILNRVLKGYRPNKMDNNNFISFVYFINKLINQENENAALEIDKVNIGKAVDYELTKDSFGEYKFQAT